VSLRLVDGDQVCIVGGGPAGSFAAIHLLSMARLRGMRLRVLIFEPRTFSKAGPAGCNRCAGVLSTRLLQGLETLGLELPQEVVQAHIQAYAAHLNGESLRIEQPDPQRKIIAVYRGGGPRILHGEPPGSFDDFLLSQARLRGAELIPSRVRLVTREDHPIVHTARESYNAHLLVLASGVNSRAPLAPQFGYKPPRTAVMAQDEIIRPSDWPMDEVNVYFNAPPGLTFGALIPKGRYLNVSLLGRGLTTDSIGDFFDAQSLTMKMTKQPESLCGCTPRIAIRPVQRYYGSRWVAVGDAAATRLYKDGIGSAFYTARFAMETAVKYGISRRDFHAGYSPHFQRISQDNRYGEMLFRQWAIVTRRPALLRAWTNALHVESNWPPARRVHARILWGIFSGDEPYRTLFWLTMSRSALLGIWRGYRAYASEMNTV
jgi:flavin-dependent dehydrogenase